MSGTALAIIFGILAVMYYVKVFLKCSFPAWLNLVLFVSAWCALLGEGSIGPGVWLTGMALLITAYVGPGFYQIIRSSK